MSAVPTIRWRSRELRLRVGSSKFVRGLANGRNLRNFVVRRVLTKDGSRTFSSPLAYAVASRLTASWMEAMVTKRAETDGSDPLSRSLPWRRCRLLAGARTNKRG